MEILIVLMVAGMLASPSGLASTDDRTKEHKEKKEKKDKGRDRDPPSVVPCSDPRGCPDLTIDSIRVFNSWGEDRVYAPPTDCAVMEGSVEPGNRTLVQFTTKIPNLGDGDLFLGDPALQPQFFEWHACHNHFHFRGYAAYRLWDTDGFRAWNDEREAHPEETSQQTLDRNPELRDHMVSANKLGFCLIDVERPAAHHSPGRTYTEPPKFFDCGFQGISREWADVYGSRIVGQWVDVTGLPPGLYFLELETNPFRTILESDYTDNRGSTPIIVGSSGLLSNAEVPPGIIPGPITIPPRGVPPDG